MRSLIFQIYLQNIQQSSKPDIHVERNTQQEAEIIFSTYTEGGIRTQTHYITHVFQRGDMLRPIILYTVFA